MRKIIIAGMLFLLLILSLIVSFGFGEKKKFRGSLNQIIEYDLETDYKLRKKDSLYRDFIPYHYTYAPNKVTISPHPGWPKSIPSRGDWWAGPSRVVVGDLDGDKKDELILLIQGDDSLLIIFNEDGSIRKKNILPGPMFESFSVDDLDNDGKKEIILLGRKNLFRLSLYIFDDRGNVKIRKEFSQCYYNYIPPIIEDINNDDKKEIIIKTSIPGDSYMLILDNKGNIISEWAFNKVENVCSDVECYPIVGNFDDDSELEIVFPVWFWEGDNDYTYIKVFNMDGTIVPGWDNIFISDLIFTPISGDINHDGYDEIIFNDWSGYTYIIDKNGQFLLRNNYGDAHGTPVIGDINNDGNLEIVFTLREWYDEHLLVLDKNGNELFKVAIDTATRFSPVIGDIDGDSLPDIVVSSVSEINAFNCKGERIDGFPLQIAESETAPSPTISDIDNDGKVEIIASTDSELTWDKSIIYVWDIDSVYNSHHMPWKMFQHDTQHTGRVYVKNWNLPPINISLSREINRSLFRKEAFHTISWSPHPMNSKFVIIKYKIYKKYDGESDGSYQLIGSVPGDTFEYVDKYLPVDKKFIYVLTSVESSGHESVYSLPVTNDQ